MLTAVPLALALCATGHACDIPVFQYALEFWEADPYRVTVFHRGPLETEQEQALTLLHDAGDAQKPGANLQVTAVDLEGQADAFMSQLWAAQSQARTPWMVVRYPAETGMDQTVWAGPFNLTSARQLVASPARQEIARRLVDRQTALWVLLESGARRKDAAAARLLETELARLEKTLQLPIAEGWGPVEDRRPAQDEIRFSMMRLARDDPDEQMLVSMLLQSERDLGKFSDEPMVFPLYGKGLILHALVGSGINEWTLNDAGEFVTGPCSCEVKASNPGTDLLLAVNWDAVLQQKSAQSLPPMTGMGSFGDRTAEAEQRMAELDRQVAEGLPLAGTSDDDGTGPAGGVTGDSDRRRQNWWLVPMVVGLLLALGMAARRQQRLKRVEKSNHEHLAT